MTRIDVDGLADFQRDLAATGRNVDGEMKKAYRKISNHAQTKARKNAGATAGPFAERFRAARTAIKSYATAREAAIGVSRSGRIPHAQATFWGTKSRSGWYGRAKYEASTGRQHPEWVGENWDAGVPGQGPYVLNYTIAEERDEIDEMFGDAMDELFLPAFPDPF